MKAATGRAGFYATRQGLGEHERGSGFKYAPERAGGAGRFERKGPPGLAARADLGDFYRALRLLPQLCAARQDSSAAQREPAD